MSDEHLKTLLLVRSILFTISLNNLYVRIGLYVVIFLNSSFEKCVLKFTVYMIIHESLFTADNVLAHNELVIMINFIEIQIDNGGYPKCIPSEQV